MIIIFPPVFLERKAKCKYKKNYLILLLSMAWMIRINSSSKSKEKVCLCVLRGGSLITPYNRLKTQIYFSYLLPFNLISRVLLYRTIGYILKLQESK